MVTKRKTTRARAGRPRKVVPALDTGPNMEAADVTRASRDQDTRANDTVHEPYDTPFMPSVQTDAPLPREGYTQKWVRITIEGKEDFRNLQRASRQGYEPRELNTIPRSFPVPRMKHGSFQGALVVGDVVLMERPSTITDAVRRQNDQKVVRLQRSVEENLFQVHQPGHGLGAPRFLQNDTRVEKGRRRVEPMSDDMDGFDAAEA